jgi:hypothetical protein
MHITEVCIDELVREFLELPCLHRVEHSITFWPALSARREGNADPAYP